jgi:hypothetical protein
MKKFLSLIALVGASFAQELYFEDKTENLPTDLMGSTNTTDIEVADLNGDTYPDIVVAGEVAENYILFNDGTGNFFIDDERRLPDLNPNDPYPGEDSEDVSIVDINGDTFPDLIFVSEDTCYHEVYLNDGTGKFTLTNWIFPTSVANALAVFDINGDKNPDILIGNKGQNTLWINDGNGFFVDRTNPHFPKNDDFT